MQPFIAPDFDSLLSNPKRPFRFGQVHAQLPKLNTGVGLFFPEGFQSLKAVKASGSRAVFLPLFYILLIVALLAGAGFAKLLIAISNA
jgi:hypothetical protein